MGCNSSAGWNRHQQGLHQHRGNWWIVPLVILGLVILTRGWILFLPLMALAGFALVGFVLPKLIWHMQQGNWQRADWQAWSSEKRKRGDFQQWGAGHFGGRWDEKPKRDDKDDIEYV